MQPGSTQPLTPSEIEEAFASAPHKNKHRAYWLDSDGENHRDGDLPASVYVNGSQVWYQHGKNHRDGDLPASVWEDGDQEWRQHGEHHRPNGLPAIIYSNGKMSWYEHGEITGTQDNPPPNALFPGQKIKSASKRQ